MNAKTLDWMPVWRYSAVLLTALAIAAAAVAEETSETRSSATSEGKGIARGELTDDAISYDEHAALRIAGERKKASRSKD